MSELDIIKEIAVEERNRTLDIYNSTSGKCIETSDRITDRILTETKIKACSYQIWCLYEFFENCTDICYEEHWITYILYKGRRIYIDATMDQFQWAFLRLLPEIYMDTKLPNFYLIREPGKSTLDKCGWNSWYNTGRYINNFNYWG